MPKKKAIYPIFFYDNADSGELFLFGNFALDDFRFYDFTGLVLQKEADAFFAETEPEVPVGFAELFFVMFGEVEQSKSGARF